MDRTKTDTHTYAQAECIFIIYDLKPKPTATWNEFKHVEKSG